MNSMTIVKQFFIITLLNCPAIMTNQLFTDKKGDIIQLQWLTSPDIEPLHSIYYQGFKHAYHSFTPEQIGITEDFEDHLEHMFQECREHVKNAINVMHCLIARKENNIIGFAIFELLDSETVYLYSLAIDPNMHGRGLGRPLIFSIFEKEPQAKKIVLHTRSVNQHAIDFYTHLGFIASTAPANAYPDLAHILVGLEFNRYD